MKVLCQYDLKFLKYTNVKLKIADFEENFTFDPQKLDQILTKDKKTNCKSRVLVQNNPLFFR